MNPPAPGALAEQQLEPPGESPPPQDSPLAPEPEPEDRYHSKDYAGASVHGPDTNLQVEDCQECHGADLSGGNSEVSCDPCHETDWRDNCTYCHGGDAEGSGAPPRDIDGEDAPEEISFRAHTSHVTQSNHESWDCVECHVQPTDVLSPGHLFDDSPGRAEVEFSGGLAYGAVYDSAGGCSNVYCHGDGGGTNGDSQDDGQALTCGSCHPSPDSGVNSWGTMSGEHSLHLQDGMVCADCHAGVVNQSQTVVGPSLHVDGDIDSTFSDENISWDGDSCTGLCHLKIHLWKSWE
jgi:hypothetical protein